MTNKIISSSHTIVKCKYRIIRAFIMRIFTFFNIKRAKSEHSTFFFGICIEYNELRLIGHCQICVRRSLTFCYTV